MGFIDDFEPQLSLEIQVLLPKMLTVLRALAVGDRNVDFRDETIRFS
jgi:hypothetical protein